MKKLPTAALNIILAAGCFFTAPAQQTETLKLGLDDLYKNKIFKQKGINTVRWMKDNEGYSALETNKNIGGKDIVSYNAKTGNREVLVSAENLIP
ncbi:hypothetical protein, partial [Labilibaculum sp.]|uniref:hypothetical protein n=1 Tax=Labilibaculum sp. TaxID=2060723 RepID=UPI0035658415